MRTKLVTWGLCLGIVAGSGLGHAQVTANGEAFATSILLGGTEIVPTAKTGPQSATQPDFFDVRVSEATIDALAPALIVDIGSSSTRGLTLDRPNASDPAIPAIVVRSAGGDAVAEILNASADPGIPPPALARAVTRQSEVLFSCEGAGTIICDSNVDLLEIAGNPVPIPGDMPVELIPGVLTILEANRRACSCSAATRSCQGDVLGLRFQLVTEGEVVEVLLSGASGSLTNLPADCPLLRFPILSQSEKTVVFVSDADGDERVDAGDRLRYTVDVRNTGAGAATNVFVLDRLPTNVTLDPGSIRVGGAPASGSVGACPGDVPFERCGETPIDTSRQCLRVDVGTVAPSSAIAVTFEVTANDSNSVCNEGLIFTNEIPPNPVGPTTSPGDGQPLPTATPAGATPTPGPQPTPTPTQTGAERCDPGEGARITLNGGAPPTAGRGQAVSAGRLAFQHDCENTAVRFRGVTFEVDGDPSLLDSIRVDVSSPNADASPGSTTAVASPVTRVVSLSFDSTLVRGGFTGMIDVSMTTAGGGTLARGTPPALGGWAMTTGLVLVGVVFVASPRRRGPWALAVLVALGLSWAGCSDDDDDGGLPANTVEVRLVDVDAFDPSNSIAVDGLPVSLGRITVGP